jgi:uncharacterized membrane protein
MADEIARPGDPEGGGERAPGLAGFAVTMTRQTTVSAYISPEDLRGYHEIDPKLAKLILEHNLAANAKLAAELEKENAHRRTLEAADQAAEVEDREAARAIERRGQICAVVVCLSAFAVCAYALASGHEAAAIWLGCTMTVSLVGAFLLGRWLPAKQDSPQPDPPSTTATPP